MVKHNVVFMPVGEKQCGDSILVRFGDFDANDPAKQAILLIDGGYTEDYKQVLELVKDKFNANKIDLVVSTHPDMDHISGLTGVLNNIEVGKLWMHLPWNHSDEFLTDRQTEFTNEELSEKLQKALQASNDLALAADAQNVQVEEPFAGMLYETPFGKITVLGPSVKYYEELLPQIIEKSIQSKSSMLLSTLTGALSKGYERVANIFESHDIETLGEKGETSPSNNTSVILMLEIGDKKILLTGDAGIPALELAYSNYVNLGHSTGELNLIQVPHHGSRRNISPSVLDKFLGQRTDQEGEVRGIAIASVGKECTKDGHPKKITSNAFRRRGYPMYQTKGIGLKYGHELDGFSGGATPLPHFSEVEGTNE